MRGFSMHEGRLYQHKAGGPILFCLGEDEAGNGVFRWYDDEIIKAVDRDSGFWVGTLSFREVVELHPPGHMERINFGTAVYFRTGGPAMIVLGIVDEKVKCRWYHRGQFRTETFYEIELTNKRPIHSSSSSASIKE